MPKKYMKKQIKGWAGAAAKAHVEPGAEAVQHLIFMKTIYTKKTILIKLGAGH